MRSWRIVSCVLVTTTAIRVTLAVARRLYSSTHTSSHILWPPCTQYSIHKQAPIASGLKSRFVSPLRRPAASQFRPPSVCVSARRNRRCAHRRNARQGVQTRLHLHFPRLSMCFLR